MKMPLSNALAGIDTGNLVQIFAAGPQRLRRSVEDLDVAELAATPRTGKWSIQQIVFHVVDAEIVGSVRFKLMYAQPGQLLPGYDQDTWANAFGYAHFHPEQLQETLKLFRLLRSDTSRLLQRCITHDFLKTGIHPERGVMTFRQLLELYADHSERHIAQILYNRNAIGKPLALPMLMEERLY